MSVKDSRTENFLTQMGANWKYTNNVTFNMLMEGWDDFNLARPGVKAKIEDAILEYAALMEAGSAAPAPILWKTPKGMEVLDGVQRLSAEQMAGATKFSAYVIDTDSASFARTIRIFANLRLQGGHQEDAQWTMAQAITILVNEHNMSAQEIAKLGGWKLSEVEKKKEYLDWSFTIRQIGGPDKLTQGIVKEIATHAKLHDLHAASKPIAEFCRDLVRGKFSNGDSAPHIQTFFEGVRPRKNLHDEYERRLESFRKDPEVERRLQGRPSTHLSGETRIRRSLKTAHTEIKRVLNQHLPVPYVEEFYHMLGQLHTMLEEIAKNSKKAVKG